VGGCTGRSTVADIKAMTLKPEDYWLRGGDDRYGGVKSTDKFFFADEDAVYLIFANHFIWSPTHPGWLGVFVNLFANNNTAIEDASVLVKLPSSVVITHARVFTPR
jgi:hypothetical protein